MARKSWIDPNTNEPLIDDYAKQLDTFVETFLDGRVDDQELQSQEDRLTTLMKEVEPELNDEQHEKVTKLLCEMTAYTIMQCFHELEQSRPKTTFRG